MYDILIEDPQLYTTWPKPSRLEHHWNIGQKGKIRNTLKMTALKIYR